MSAPINTNIRVEFVYPLSKRIENKQLLIHGEEKNIEKSKISTTLVLLIRTSLVLSFFTILNLFLRN